MRDRWTVATKRDWLDAGLAILALEGLPALTIDGLTTRLGITKGSFYHHFAGMSGYKTALLEHFEAEWTTRYIAIVDDDPAPARAKLDRLIELVLGDGDRPDPEIAIRAWALQDQEVRSMQERVDRIRFDYVRALWQEHSGDAAEAERMGRLLYLIVVGAGSVVPPVPADELRAVYALAMGSAIGGRTADPKGTDT